MLILAATGSYVLLEVYKFNLVTLVSWAAMVVVSLLFIWGNIHRILGKYVILYIIISVTLKFLTYF